MRQTAFRIRTDFSAPLGADEGWGGAIDESATVDVEHPFRLRFELAGDGRQPRYGLQYRRNGGDWLPVEAADFPYAEVEELTPRVSIISAPAYSHGAATIDLLEAADAPFAGGAGIALSAESPAAPDAVGQTEWEWALVVRRFADGAVTNETGDSFDFRMSDANGNPVAASRHATVTVRVPPRLLGGTFVETPGRIGPWQATSGDLYFLMEPAESFNVLMVMKSSDGGATWREVDAANRPLTDDLEGFASSLAGDTIHMLHQVSEKVVYHSYRTVDHATQPDSWAIRDELVAEPVGEPPVQVASIEVRSDGSVVAVYGGPEKIHIRVRSASGTWGEEMIVDEDQPVALSGPQTVIDARDRVHLAYTADDGTAWYREILPNGRLTPREQIASDLGTAESDSGSILPLAVLADESIVVIYRNRAGKLVERRTGGYGPLKPPIEISERKVVQSAVDSDQAGADAISDGQTVHVLFIDEDSGSLFHTHSGEDGSWPRAELVIDGIRGQWVRGAVIEFDASRRYGFVYDAGSDGGSGPIWYADLPLGGRSAE